MSSIVDFRHLTDSQWLELLIASTKSENVQGLRFPRYPDLTVQALFVGSSNEHALQEAFRFYDFFKAEAEKAGSPLRASASILDFGTGWGRFLRFFWKDVKESGLHGVDVDPVIIESCRSLGVPGELRQIAPLGPLPYGDASMDVILAYSVFTHLPEHVHRHWMGEFKRVVRPGGIVALMIEPRRFLARLPGAVLGLCCRHASGLRFRSACLSPDWWRRLPGRDGLWRRRLPRHLLRTELGAGVRRPCSCR